MALKKIDKLKNSSANRIAKEKKNQPISHPSHLSSEQNAATLSTQLHYAERQLFVPDWISKIRALLFFPASPLLYMTKQ